VEKRLVPFLLTSSAVVIAWVLLNAWVNPPKPKPNQQPQQIAKKEKGEDGNKKQEGDPKPDAANPDASAKAKPKKGEKAKDGTAEKKTGTDADKGSDTDKKEKQANKPGPSIQAAPVSQPQKWYTLGSVDPESDYRMLVTFNNRGATVQRIELANPKFRDLDNRSGYLGYLAFTRPDEGDGCVVQVVGPGTPAAAATPTTEDVSTPGLHPGDILFDIDGTPIGNRSEYERFMKQTKPGQELLIKVRRPAPKTEVANKGTNDQPKEQAATAKMTTVALQVTLGRRPLCIVQPEYDAKENAAHPMMPDDDRVLHQMSFLTTLQQIGDRKLHIGDEEIEGVLSLRDSHWEKIEFSDAYKEKHPNWQDEVCFQLILSKDYKKQVHSPSQGGLQIIKRFRLARVTEETKRNAAAGAYHLTFAIEIRNLGQKPLKVAYRQDGPTGTPYEGWWYQHKIHPSHWGAAGVRDVLWRSDPGRFTMIRCLQITTKAKKDEQNPVLPLFNPADDYPMRYIGVDTQYFSAIMMPPLGADLQEYHFQEAQALVVGNINPNFEKLTDVTFRLISKPVMLPPYKDASDAFQKEFTIFAGPKEPRLLNQYGLRGTIVYGYFFFVAKPMLMLLHLFHDYLVFNYALAIILLTVLVRGCMFPLSRKQVRGMQKMQELQPEIKQIAETYKDDMEKRTKAQQELFKKHNYNPMSGCLLAFFQFPIFIGLYRSLSVDIWLRQAPAIPGSQWCANLAAPDQLWYWQPHIWPMFSNPGGWLGPYFNILPLFTIVLFLVQQKLFTPPPVDEQQEMQQKMMSFMMLFIGVLFFKVAAGLCIYFIASSLWGIAERKLLPRPVPLNTTVVTPESAKRKARGQNRKKRKR